MTHHRCNCYSCRYDADCIYDSAGDGKSPRTQQVRRSYRRSFSLLLGCCGFSATDGVKVVGHGSDVSINPVFFHDHLRGGAES